MDTTLKTRLLQTFVAMIVVLIVGTFGYYFICDRQSDLFTCFYMTVITITTIGYDELIPIKDYTGGRPFTIFLAFAGIGILTYFVSSVSAVVIEGHLRQSYKKRKMEKSIEKLQNHFIVCGVGKHAMHIIEELISTERQCVFIELDKDVIKDVMIRFPMQLYIEGDASNDDILIKAGVRRAKGLFASTSDDNMNLVISLSARNLNPSIKIVALCINYDNQEKIKIAGADTIVSPNYIGGLRMASEMVRPAVTNFIDTMLRDKTRNLRIEDIEMTESQEGKIIGELKINEFKDTLLIAIKSNDELIFKPDDNFKISRGDVMIVMTCPDERIKLENLND